MIGLLISVHIRVTCNIRECRVYLGTRLVALLLVRSALVLFTVFGPFVQFDRHDAREVRRPARLLCRRPGEVNRRSQGAVSPCGGGCRGRTGRFHHWRWRGGKPFPPGGAQGKYRGHSAAKPEVCGNLLDYAQSDRRGGHDGDFYRTRSGEDRCSSERPGREDRGRICGCLSGSRIHA